METQPFLFSYVYYNKDHTMNALTLIQTLTFTKASDTKLETATNVLAELKVMSQTKGLPFRTIRRAIKMQEKTIKNI